MEKLTASLDFRLLMTRVQQFFARKEWDIRQFFRAMARRFGIWERSVGIACIVITALALTVHQQLEDTRIWETRSAALSQAPMTNVAKVAISDLTNNSDRLNIFEELLLENDIISQVVGNLLSLSDKEHLLILHGEYHPQVDRQGRFLRYRISFPMQGEAAAIYRFIQNALQTQTGLALEKIQFKRQSIHETRVEAHLTWVVLARLPDGLHTHKTRIQ